MNNHYSNKICHSSGEISVSLFFLGALFFAVFLITGFFGIFVFGRVLIGGGITDPVPNRLLIPPKIPPVAGTV